MNTPLPCALRILCLALLLLLVLPLGFATANEPVPGVDESAASPPAAATARLPLNRRIGVGMIRAAFNREGARTRRAMAEHLPAVPVTSVEGLSYRAGDPDALLDIHYPASAASTDARLPVLVWIHGGAWLSGSRQDAAPLFRLLAAEGYAVVAPDYSLAPAAVYPQPLRQLSELHAWLERHAGDYPIDPERLFLAGDSAGAQLAAQLAAMGSNPAYAAEVGLPAVFTPDVVRGVVLQCGVLDLPALVRRERGGSRLLGWGTGTTVLAYAGTRDPDSPVLAQMSPILHLTADFPPVWITGGNADPLTAGHSVAFAARLEALAVPVTSLFWPDDHVPGLPHLYPFDLDSDEGQVALRSMLEFLRGRE
ncbi:alpha/beta hydrolase [Luteimonas sp. A482]